jgi:hypothetical protein
MNNDNHSYEIANPKPAALIESLRAVGYNLPTAVADIIDNSLTAGARNVDLYFHWAGAESRICLIDDGRGMSETELHEAMRPGSRSPLEERSPEDLGRFGLGLKTASFSQCRSLTVISKPKGAELCSRCWDLEYVADHDEWRLLKTPAPGAAEWLNRIRDRPSGTAVVWCHLDRVTGSEHTSDAAAHARFNDAIDHVRQHLALVFHRFLADGSLIVKINGGRLEAWDPFLQNHSATYRTAEERIPFGKSPVVFRGFVLPHKDKLEEAQFVAAGGPYGWAAHQGFYVYRNRRLLVFGDWLRLGSPKAWTRDEQFKLARIRLDITNETDGEWHLDVKKSTARPPVAIRDRLTQLGGEIRRMAREVFAHRGRYGPRAPVPQEIERPWISRLRNGRRVYSVNRAHPIVSAAIQRSAQAAPEIESLLRILEETIPVQQIWLDTAEQTYDNAVPYDGIDYQILRADMRRVFEVLTKSGINAQTARERMRSIEPFNRYPNLIEEL